jgi:hypothetical protein
MAGNGCRDQEQSGGMKGEVAVLFAVAWFIGLVAIAPEPRGSGSLSFGAFLGAAISAVILGVGLVSL